MRYRELQKRLSGCTISKGRLKDYTYRIDCGERVFHVLVLPVSHRHLVTVNSKHIWNIKSGNLKGIRFQTTSSRMIDLRAFNKRTNRIVLFKHAPYKILKYINESEVIDITGKPSVHDTMLARSTQALVKIVKTQVDNG